MGKFSIKITDKSPPSKDRPVLVSVKNKSFPKKPHFSFFKRKNIFLSILVGIIVGGLFSSYLYVLATLPTSKYSPGETTNPSCAPGDTNCTVVSAVPYTGATANVDLGSYNLTTTGTGTIGTLSITGTTTLGDASADTVTSNAATWTFANDTAVTLSGGVDGINFDSNTLSIDATNNRVGILDASPAAALTVGSGDLFQVNSSGAIAAVVGITSSSNYVQSAGTFSLTSANTTQTTLPQKPGLSGHTPQSLWQVKQLSPLDASQALLPQNTEGGGGAGFVEISQEKEPL